MVSRKKNKGKERKAKKEEIKKAERHSRWERFARGEDENNRKAIHCDHGCTVEIPDVLDHPVANFMDELFAAGEWVTGGWLKSLNSHAKLWSINDTYRNMTTDILLKIGTNFLLGSDSQIHGDSTSTNAAHIAEVIVILDNYKETKSANEVILSRGVATKHRDLHGGNMRDVLKFYSKRTSCSCLKKVYSDARKTLPKVGKCFHCEETKERASLSVCSKCRINHYCSRECQVAHWPCHEKCCDIRVRVHKQQTK